MDPLLISTSQYCQSLYYLTASAHIKNYSKPQRLSAQPHEIYFQKKNVFVLGITYTSCLLLKAFSTFVLA